MPTRIVSYTDFLLIMFEHLTHQELTALFYFILHFLLAVHRWQHMKVKPRVFESSRRSLANKIGDGIRRCYDQNQIKIEEQ